MGKYILVHGMGQTATAWQQLALDIKTNNLLMPNLSDWSQKDATYQTIYQAFEQYSNNIPGKIHLCGLSLGGVLAMDYAIHNPKKVASLVLIGTPIKMPKYLLTIQNMVFKLMPDKLFQKFPMSKNKILQLTKSMRELDFTKDLAKLNCKILIICGQKDHANLKSAKQMQKLIPTSKLIIISKAGHQVNIDEPKTLSAVLNKFWR